MNQNELMHYGVLGMKWGVHKNPSRAFAKAKKKDNKLDRQVAKAQAKFDKRYAKRNKVEKRFTGIGIASRGDLARAVVRQSRAKNKLDRKIKKSQKWKEEMLKNFSDVKFNDIDSKNIVDGEKYIHAIADNR